MAQLEDLESMLRSEKKEAMEKKPSKTDKRRSSSRSVSRSPKRRRSRSRSPSYSRHRRRSRSYSSDKDRRRDRNRNGRDRSRNRTRDRSRDRYRGRDIDRENRVKEELDEKPILYKIYNGKVTNLRDFGAFVSLEGVKGRVEGKSSQLYFNFMFN
jgi:ATP-dependent RNA helicase DHX8/PRP22